MKVTRPRYTGPSFCRFDGAPARARGGREGKGTEEVAREEK